MVWKGEGKERFQRRGHKKTSGHYTSRLEEGGTELGAEKRGRSSQEEGECKTE